MNAEKIVELSKEVVTAVNGGRAAKFAKLRLSSALAELRDRTAAVAAACQLFDDLKSSGKFAKIVSGTVTVMEHGIETVKEKKYDPSANARGVIQRAINSAYANYEDTFVLVTHKSKSSWADFKPRTASDGLTSIMDKLFEFLELTQAEETSLRYTISRAAINAAHEAALIINTTRDGFLAAEAKKAKEAKKAAEAAMAEATVRAETALVGKGVKGVVLKAAIPALAETIYEAMRMAS